MARFCSWRAASARAWPTSISISASSRSSASTSARTCAEICAAGSADGSLAMVEVPAGFGPQSSGIRIQPWRIAYTTAWVRSLTESLRRMELMWFLTVCSLIDSA